MFCNSTHASVNVQYLICRYQNDAKLSTVNGLTETFGGGVGKMEKLKIKLKKSKITLLEQPKHLFLL